MKSIGVDLSSDLVKAVELGFNNNRIHLHTIADHFDGNITAAIPSDSVTATIKQVKLTELNSLAAYDVVGWDNSDDQVVTIINYSYQASLVEDLIRQNQKNKINIEWIETEYSALIRAHYLVNDYQNHDHVMLINASSSRYTVIHFQNNKPSYLNCYENINTINIEIESVDKIFVAGDMDAKKVHVDAELVNPFKDISQEQIQNPHQYFIAFGLAMRKFIQ